MSNIDQYKKEIYNKKHRKSNKKLISRLHFDTTLNANSAFSLVSDPNKVATHWFLPFIRFDKKIRKFKNINKETGKRDPKIRPLQYASNKDGYIYAYYSYILDKQYEKLIKETPLNESVLAYRSLEKSNIHFAKEVFSWIEIVQECNVLAIDLSSFFDNLDHEILKKQWEKVSGVNHLPKDSYMVFKSLTKYFYLYMEEVLSVLGWSNQSDKKQLNKNIPNPLRKKGNDYHQSLQDFRDIRKNKLKDNSYLLKINKTGYGIPQGSPISAILSNIYMIDFDEQCCNLAKDIKGIYRRYCDDVIITFSKDIEIDEIVSKIKRLLAFHGGKKLKVNDNKIEKIQFVNKSGVLTSIDSDTKKYKPLQYLGFTYDGQKKLIRSSSISKYYRQLIFSIRATKNQAHKNKPYRRKIYRMYSHLARKQCNFITYAYKASKIIKEPSIKKQLSRHWKRIHDELKK